ncbi:MAG: TIGR04282 family arsenosugar biosynthesis glycosyltransferase [Alphaproteobacteria bacterium]
MKPHLVIFARAPRRGAVKRRLAADIGDGPALAFYRQTLHDVTRRLGGDPRWRTWLAVTPDTAATRPEQWPAVPGVRLIPQGSGDLGARMARPMRELPPGPVIIVGTDIPDITAGHIADGFAALGSHDFVFGPAVDGGYWLVGSRRRPNVPKGLFRGVRWSTEHALADTLAGLPQRARVTMLGKLDDVDDGAAWAALRKRRRS